MNEIILVKYGEIILKGGNRSRFEKVLIKKGEKKTVTFNLTEGDFTYVDENYKTRILRGTHKILIEDLDAEIEI